MVIERSGSLVEAASVPRIRESESLEVEVVAELVAQGAQKCSKGRNLLPHRRPHPQADQHGLGTIVAEKFCRPVFAHSKRSGCKHANAAVWDFIEPRCRIQKFGAGAADISTRPGCHRRFYGFRTCEQASVLRQVESP